MTKSTGQLDIDATELNWPERLTRLATPLGIGGGVLLAALMALSLRNTEAFRHFSFTYLSSYCYFLSLAVGALFFVAIQHAARAGWSVSVRRLAEILGGTVPALAVLFLPVLVPLLFGSHALYEWNDAAAVQADELLRHKQPYLNVWFFLIRCVIYFGVWTMLARFFHQRSLQQDRSGLSVLTLRMERMSPAALILLAVTVTFAAFDFLMSLEPHWYSTIYGVYYFSGAAVGSIAVIILLAVGLQSSGRLTNLITTEHYHDLGKLLFAFVVFWGYIAFSQYMLIWYANIPEETVWYQPRNTGAWGTVSVVLLFGHLLIPFLGLMSRQIKRRKYLLAFWAVWLLVAHWIDIYWLVMPTYAPQQVPFGAVDLGCLVGLGCVFFAAIVWSGRGGALVAVRDPRLPECLSFENI